MEDFVFRYKPGETAKTFFTRLKSFLHAIISQANETWLENLCLRIEAVLQLSPLETEVLKSAITQKDKLLKLFTIIESRSFVSENALEDFLNCIINFPGLPNESYTAELRKIISTKFSAYIDIVENKDEPTLNQSASVIKNNIEKEKGPLLSDTTDYNQLHLEKSKCQEEIKVACIFTIIICVGIIVFLLLQYIGPTTTGNDSDLSGNETFVNNTTTYFNSNDSFLVSKPSRGYAEKENSSAEEINLSDNNDTSSTITPNDILKRTNVTDQNNINLKTVRFKASSCEDYKTYMTNPPRKRRISMHIQPSSPYDFEHCNMDNAEKISELSFSGPITLADTFLKILNHTKNIEELHLFNTKSAFCNRNKGLLSTLINLKAIGRQRVELPKLHTLYMESFTSCKEVFEALANYISYGKLSRFVMKQCVYDNENQAQIEHLLKTNRGSLKSVSFPGTQWATTLASENLATLGKVETFEMDFTTNVTVFHNRYLGTQFGRVFSNIRNFTSSVGYLPLDQLSDIFQLIRLQNLQIGLHVPEGVEQFDVSFLRKFPDMVKAEFFLEFPNCRTGNRKKLVGLNTLSDKLRSLIIRSNCVLFTPGEKLDQRVEKTREKGCLYESFIVENITEH